MQFVLTNNFQQVIPGVMLGFNYLVPSRKDLCISTVYTNTQSCIGVAGLFSSKHMYNRQYGSRNNSTTWVGLARPTIGAIITLHESLAWYIYMYKPHTDANRHAELEVVAWRCGLGEDYIV